MIDSWSTLILVAAVGLAAGMLASRAVERLGLAQSLFWPIGNYCPHCLAARSRARSIPLASAFPSQCSTCGRSHSRRPAVVQLVTLCLWTGLFVLYSPGAEGYAFPWYPLPYDESKLFALLVYHGILVTLLVIATFIDLDAMVIPDSITVPGMLLGVGLGTFWYVELHPVPLFPPGFRAQSGLLSPDFFADWLGRDLGTELEGFRVAVNEHWRDHWNRWLGFLTSIVGLVIGGGVVWVVRFVMSWIFGVEAIGFGDVTLMAMIGSFLGWQTVVIAFFLAPISAVVVGVAFWLWSGQRAIAYGPHLSLAAVACIFLWRPIWRSMAEVFEHTPLVLFMSLAMLVVLVAVASMIQGVKMIAARAMRGRG